MSTGVVEGWLRDLGASRKGVQRAAAEALAAALPADEVLRRRLVNELDGADPRRRWGAAYALSCAEPAPSEIVPVLVEALGTNDGDLRWAAARILVRLVEQGGAERRMVRDLLRAASALRRKMGLYCLRELGPDAGDSPGAFVAALDDTDRDVRLAALAATATLRPRDPEVAHAMMRRLADADAGVRRAAAAGLGRLGVGDAAVRSALRRAAEAGDVALRRAAESALSRLGAAPGDDPPPRGPRRLA